MYFRLENKESRKSQEINLLRVYNRSRRSWKWPVSVLSEDEKGNLLASLVAETFWNCCNQYLFSKRNCEGRGIGSKLYVSRSWSQNRNCHLLLSMPHRFQAPGYKGMATRSALLCKTIPTLGKDIITKEFVTKIWNHKVKRIDISGGWTDGYE